MATNIKTVMTYQLNGATTDFAIPFEYLARKFVQVTLIGVDRKVLVLNHDYRFATKALISTTRAWGPADGYQLIEIRRYTSATERLVDFTDGSILRAYDLNISQIQTLHVAEEARDLTADTIGVNNDGHLDARGRRIVNLADGVDDSDAISVGQVKRMNQNSWQARNEAQGFRNEAQGFRNEAEGFRNQAATSKQSAANSESQSWNHSERSRYFADASEGSANSAGQSATNASNSAGSAKTSENNAWTSWDNAQKEANRSRYEADRSKREADKLGNMNQLSESIESVTAQVGDTSGKVVWKYDIDSRILRAYGGMSLGREWDGQGYSPFFNFYRGKGEPSGSLLLDANKTVRFIGMNHVNFDSTINAQDINCALIHSKGNFVADGTLYVNGSDYIHKDTWVPNGANRITNIIRGSVGGYACDEYFAEIVGSHTERGWQLSGGGTDTTMRIKGNGNFEIFGNRGARIVINGGAIVEQDGNIRGSIWEGKWLRDFMNDRFLTDVWLGGGEWVATNREARTDYVLSGGSVCAGYTQDASGGVRNAWLDGMFHRKLWIRFGNGFARVIGSA